MAKIEKLDCLDLSVILLKSPWSGLVISIFSLQHKSDLFLNRKDRTYLGKDPFFLQIVNKTEFL